MPFLVLQLGLLKSGDLPLGTSSRLDPLRCSRAAWESVKTFICYRTCEIPARIFIQFRATTNCNLATGRVLLLFRYLPNTINNAFGKRLAQSASECFAAGSRTKTKSFPSLYPLSLRALIISSMPGWSWESRPRVPLSM